MSKAHKFLCRVEAAFKTSSLSESESFEGLVEDIDSVFRPNHTCFDDSDEGIYLTDWRAVIVGGGAIVLEADCRLWSLQLSGCYNLYLLERLRLLVAARRQYGPLEKEASEFLHQSCIERKKLITALQIILKAIVLQRNLKQDSGAIIQKVMQDHLKNGLRTELINLIKHCGEEAITVSCGLDSPSYIVDSEDVHEELVMLAHCLFLSSLVVQPSPGDLIDVFCMLKHNAAALVRRCGGSGYQVICGLLFSIIIPLLPASADAIPSIFTDESRNTFHESVMTSMDDEFQNGLIACVRLAWAIHLMLIEKDCGRECYPVFSSEELLKIESCLDTVFLNNAFEVFVDIFFKNFASKADKEDLIPIYNASLHKLITTLLSIESFQFKVEEVIDMTRLFPRGSFEDECKDPPSTKKAFERANKQIVSLLQFVCEIYKREPQLLAAAASENVWCLGASVWNKIGTYEVYDASLMFLCTLAYNEKGALSVFKWVQDEMRNPFSWRNFFSFLKECSKSADFSLSEFPEDTALIIAFLHLLMMVLRNGNAMEREHWFPDVEPLFMFLNSRKLPDQLEDKVKDTINTFIRYCPGKKAAIEIYCKNYNVQVSDDRSQRGKRPRPSSMEDVCDDMGQPKPKGSRQYATELITESISKDKGDGGSATTRGYKNGPLVTYLIKTTQIDYNIDPVEAAAAIAAAPITTIRRKIQMHE